MKTIHLSTLVLLMSGCASTPLLTRVPDDQSMIKNTIIVEQVRFATPLDCPAEALDVSARICNLWHWQTYLQDLNTSPLTEKDADLSGNEVSLMLQQALTKLHPEQSIEVQQQGLSDLDGIVDHLEPTVSLWFRGVMSQAAQQIELRQLAASQRKVLDEQALELKALQGQLKEAEKKIEALTEIEQQLGDAP